MLDGLETGASVAHNGCCLTVTEINGNHVSFDLMKETLRITNLGDLKVGDWVNVERAAKFSDEIGGTLNVRSYYDHCGSGENINLGK